MNVEIAIGDFGTGYSSLAYLQTVTDLVASECDQKRGRAMIAMGHDLGYRVVAEGIEPGSLRLAGVVELR
jgi:EAL domain-containing protein (putative c-di-GMP-specific phosphodiesterase class I)